MSSRATEEAVEPATCAGAALASRGVAVRVLEARAAVHGRTFTKVFPAVGALPPVRCRNCIFFRCENAFSE